VDSLSKLAVDSTYVPEDVSEEEEVNNEFPCCFSLIEEVVQEFDDGKELNEDELIVTGSKRPCEMDNRAELVPTDLETDNEIFSAQVAIKFWTALFKKVSYVEINWHCP
jgi:hypothetical protein